MDLLKFLASLLGVVTVLMMLAFVCHEKSKAALELRMASYQKELKKAKQRAAQERAQENSELRVMSLRHRKAMD